MKLGSFCTGYGGLDMAVEAHFGADLTWYSEVDKDCNQLLAHHWPGVPNLGDLTTIDWGQVEPVDIMCAGFPCQPFSTAGKREGENDERAIFAYIADAIGVLRPGIVVLENVSGLLTLGGPGVVGTLAGLGYDLRWGLVRAADAGAPHRRARWFCIATDTAGVGLGERTGSGESKPTGQRRDGPGHGHRTAPTDSDRERFPQPKRATLAVESEQPRAASFDEGAPDASSPQLERHREEHEPCETRLDTTSPAADHRATTNAPGNGLEGIWTPSGLEEESGEPRRLDRFGPYEPAVSRWEQLIGRRAPDPTDDRGLRPGFVEWMMGLPEGHVCGLGLSRTAELKMLGNGVVPQQAAVALALLNQ